MIKKAKTSNNGGRKYNYINILSGIFENNKQFICYNDQKEPICPIKLKKVDITTKDNLTSFNEAINSADRHELGVGIVLGKTNKGNLCGIDIDNCIDENNNLSKEVKEIINLLDSYTEISISGKGIHILFFANKIGNKCKNNKLKFCKCLEMYDKNRYFTLSGNMINNKNIESRQEQADYIYKNYFEQEQTQISEKIPKTKITNTSRKIADYEKHFKFALLVDKKLKNYNDGIRLIKDRNGKPDESANDNAFINKLAYWLNDYCLIKHFFLISPYFEQKDQKHKDKCIKRQDYLHRTILKALGGQ